MAAKLPGLHRDASDKRSVTRCNRHASRQSAVELTNRLRLLGHPTERAEMVLATLNDLMACYMAHCQRLKANL
jgi:hypothetical protein